MKNNNFIGLIGFILSLVSIFNLGVTAFLGLIISIAGYAVSYDTNDKRKLSIAGIFISLVMLIIFFVLILSAINIKTN